MNFKSIKLDVSNNIATLSLARTETLNSISLAFADEIIQAVKHLDSDDDVNVIILKSDARIFCAGMDLKDFASLGFDGKAKSSLEFPIKIDQLFECCNVFEECRKPVIAAVHGACVGGGLDMISACDIRLCSEDATFCLKEAAIGFVADMGVLQRLPFIIGQGFTREMAFTARFYAAREVERMGMINMVYPDVESLMEGAKKLAAQIAANAPLAVGATKEVLNYNTKAAIQEGMSMAVHKNMVLVSSEDVKEAASAFIEKRNPNFKGR
ncbi:MAG: enoyl-CoA hydratase/isomerase family protein [Deltaproteobacteria bacterium]|nr:enoyl-CoA hydratase/isomerase family protein [Deltaproteobacteria bacterium]